MLNSCQLNVKLLPAIQTVKRKEKSNNDDEICNFPKQAKRFLCFTFVTSNKLSFSSAVTYFGWKFVNRTLMFHLFHNLHEFAFVSFPVDGNWRIFSNSFVSRCSFFKIKLDERLLNLMENVYTTSWSVLIIRCVFSIVIN